VKILMTFPAELKNDVAESLADEKRIFDKGSRNPVMGMLDKMLKITAGVPKEINIHAIEFGYAITSDTTAELIIVTPVEGLYKPEWIANKLEKEFVKADPRIHFEVKEDGKA